MSPCLSFSLQFLPFCSRGPREPSSPGFPSGLSFGKVTSCFPPVPRRRYGFCRLGMTGPITSGMPGFVPCLAADLPFFFRLLLIKIKEKSIHAHNRREVNTRSIISDIIVFSRVLWVVCVFTCKNDILIFSYTSLSTIFLWLSSFDSSGFKTNSPIASCLPFSKFPPSMTSKSDHSVSSHCHYFFFHTRHLSRAYDIFPLIIFFILRPILPILFWKEVMKPYFYDLHRAVSRVFNPSLLFVFRVKRILTPKFFFFFFFVHLSHLSTWVHV